MNYILKCFRRCYNAGVYRLELANNKIYVGSSNDIKKRIWYHEQDNGSAWTKKYHFVKQLKPLTSSDSPFWELEETLENMHLYGIDNVRGSMFTKIYLNRKDKILAAQLYCEMYNLCRKCGSSQHFVTYCRSNKVEPWVHKFGGELDLNSRKCIKCNADISHKPEYYKYCANCMLCSS
jgi:hypothetical protein